MESNQTRLDASESVFFKRELETIDSKTYDVKFPMLKGRMLLPKVADVAESDAEYTYRQHESFGEAKIIADNADDLPNVDTVGREFTARIKPLGAKFQYNLFEIRAAASKNRPLDQLKARAARRAIEEKIDSLLASGSAAHDMKGFINHADVDATFSASTKAAGGKTWLSGGLPNATARECIDDVNSFVNALWTGLKEAEGIGDRISVVLPSAEYAYIASLPIGDNADKTVLRYLLDNSPFLSEITPWSKLTGAGGGGENRMIAYVKDPMVLGALVPMEYSPQPFQQRGLNFHVPVVASCGGTVIRYPVAVRYGDDL